MIRRMLLCMLLVAGRGEHVPGSLTAAPPTCCKWVM